MPANREVRFSLPLADVGISPRRAPIQLTGWRTRKWLSATTVRRCGYRYGPSPLIVAAEPVHATTDSHHDRANDAVYTSVVLGEGGVATASGIQVEIQEATEDVAASLGLEPGTEVISRHRKRYIDGVPWALETSFYPGEFADSGADRLRRVRDIEEGTVNYLRDSIGVRQVGYRNWVTVRAPNATEADYFKLLPDGRVAVYEMFRTAFDENEQPMRLTVTVVRADRNQFIVDVGNVPGLKPSDQTQQSLPTSRGAPQAPHLGLQ